MTAAESVAIQASKAHDNYQAILQCRYNIAANFLTLGRLFKENRDLSFYKLLGHDSFEDFLGDVSFSRAKVYGLIQVYELYVEKLGVPERDILEVGTSKLLMLASVVESAPEDWIAKGKALSKSDLRVEITGQAAGDKPLSPPPSPSARPVQPAMTPADYIRLVEASPCCVCGRSPATKAHYPRTRVRCDQPWHVIPLCGACHREQEDGGMEWCWQNRQAWGGWFYKTIAGD